MALLSNIQRIRARLRRPFANAHWSLLVGLIVAGQLWIWLRSCGDAQANIDLALGALVCVLALWLNHLRVAPVRDWHGVLTILANTLYDLLVTGVLFVVASSPLVLNLPETACYTGRAKVSAHIMGIYPQREIIEHRILSAESVNGVGEGLTLDANGFVTTDGSIVLRLDSPESMVVLQPLLASGAVHWKCVGVPTRYMPEMCRPTPP